MMLNLNLNLRQEVKELLTRCYPVVKNRPAIWFFLKDRCGVRDVKKIYSKHIYEQWYALPPEKRLKYYDMAQFDHLRYREQKTLWIAEIGSILVNKCDNIDELSDSLQQVKKRQKELIEELVHNKIHYDKTIKLNSTRKYLKDVLLQTKNLQTKFSQEQLTSALPEGCKPYLALPQLPSNPFFMFRSEQKDYLMKINRENPHLQANQVASIEWNNLTKEQRAEYYGRYYKLLDKYNQAKAQFENESGTFLKEAAKEKALFSRSLRKRLREFDLIPRNPRNAFNFFLQDYNEKNLKHIGERVHIWRSLDSKEKEKYWMKAQEDIVRYAKEREIYEEFIKTVEKLFDESKIKCDITNSDLDVVEGETKD